MAMTDDAPLARAEYLEELRGKTLHGGRVFAACVVGLLVFFIFQDIKFLEAPPLAIAFRAIAMLCSGFFLCASFTLFRKQPKWIIPAHIAQLFTLVVQMCGFTCVLFYVRPNLPTYPYGTTSGILISFVGAFVFAYGARRVLWLLLVIPMAATMAFILLFCSPTPEELALFSNPIAISPGLIAVALAQERSAFGEFQMRQLALRRQAELEVTAEALRASNEDLEHFSRAASHDLRQPLNSILGFLNMTQRSLPDRYESQAEIEEYLARMMRAARHMEALISDLLAYSQLDTAKKSFVVTDMNDVLDDALQHLDHLIRKTRAVIRRQPLPTVSGNPTLLATVLQNLVGNAIKYRQDNTAPEIDVSVQRIGVFYRFSVRDNGIGFDPRFADEVFEPFRRLHTRQTYGGTGMGLASCVRIIKQHGGTMEATGKPGVGSTFFFTLPATPDL